MKRSILAAVTVGGIVFIAGCSSGGHRTAQPAATRTTLADWLAVPVPPGGIVDPQVKGDSRAYNYPGVSASALAGFYQKNMAPGQAWNGHVWCDQNGTLGKPGGVVWTWMTSNPDELISVNVDDDGHGNGFVIVHDDVGDAPCRP